MTDTREDEVALNRAKYGGRTARRQAPASPTPPGIPRITRLMALAIKFQDMVDCGEVRDYADLARLGCVTRARMTQVMNLLNLPPDVQEAILWPQAKPDVRIVNERSVRSLTALVHWGDQRSYWAKNVTS